MDLKGQVAIVTGGGTGIGRAIALALVAQGARVVVVGRRLHPLQEVSEAIRANRGECLAVRSDVSKAADVAALVAAAEKRYGRVDILVNNAGIGGGGPIHTHDLDEWDRILAVNLRGPFLMARAVLPGMRRRRRGHILNISSESGLEHYESDGAYGVSKHALNALSEYIQRENQSRGIRVNTICPGMVVTEMTANARGLVHEKCLAPEEIAELAVWLLTRQPNLKIGTPVLIQTMQDPWKP